MKEFTLKYVLPLGFASWALLALLIWVVGWLAVAGLFVVGIGLLVHEYLDTRTVLKREACT
jgi:hypothetical protein